MARYTPLWEQAGSYAASVDRRLVGSLWPAAASSGGAAPILGGTMTVSLAPGAVAVPTQNNTGSTLCVWDAAEQVGPLAQGGSQPRIDVITCHPRGNDLDGGANNDFILDIIAGTAAASPAVPAVPAGQVALYQVAVAASAVSLSAGNLTDVRPGGLAIGGPRGLVTSALNAAFSSASGPVMTLTANLVAGRRYRINAYCLATQQAAAGNPLCSISDNGGYLSSNLWRLWQSYSVIQNGNAAGGSSRTIQATSSASVTFTMNASTSAGNLSITASWAWIDLEDIGT